MTYLVGDEKPSLEDLAHHGVKGMKWGVRTGGLRGRVRGAADDQFQRRITTANAVATGTAKKRDVVRTVAFTGSHVTNKKLAARRVQVLQERQARVAKGEAKVGDILSVIGHTSVADLAVSRRDKRGN